MGFRDRLYISTTASDAAVLARAHGLGLEIADYCTAENMDRRFSSTDPVVRAAMEGVDRFIFHAPFNELCPAAIDPLVRELTARRYAQALDLAVGYGIRKLVIHSGFIPLVYYPEWFVPESVGFWREFLRTVPADVTLGLENVLEPDASILCEITASVDDPRLRLCLDAGHAAVVSSAEPTEWISRMSPWLSHVHLHNNDGHRDLHRSVGDGVLDMALILDRTESLCPDVTYTIENISAAGSVDWLLAHRYI